VTGEIVLFVSATLYGQDVKDVDLMMIGMIRNYKPVLSFSVNEKDVYGNVVGLKSVKDKVEILNFCTTIEIKGHDISGIFVNGTDFYVKYGKVDHCVTAQSNKQKIAVMNFLKSTINFSPYITNVIWFNQVTRNDLDGLINVCGKKMPTNAISAEFELKELMQLLVWQKSPYCRGGVYYFESRFDDCTVSKVNDAFFLFSRTKEQIGELTRKRIELISNQAFSNNILIDTQGKVSIYRGRAGTGKTVGLIQTAIQMVDEKQARVLLLTYNKALVSDIRRLFALAELPDMFEEKCVCVNTMHSYFYRLSNRVLYDGKLGGDVFIQNYESVLKELNAFLEEDESVELVKEIIRSDVQLNWEYVLIDEAQDWTNQERDAILRLFDRGKIIIADGGLQFVRNEDACDWSIIRERNNIKLKYCLRQKENLIRFLNVFSQKLKMTGAKILANNNMPGGKIIITSDEKLFDIHRNEMDNLLNAGNIAYDMMYLVPHMRVKKTYGKTEFVLTQEFEQHGIYIWDGTNSANRDRYSISHDEIRILQYDSARGLEGWTVVCMDFDRFLKEKSDEYIEGAVDALLLESPEEKKKRYLFNWAMIPLTRAIDTLVITVKDADSVIGNILKEITFECSDYVMWI
jgi:hypothetical protein